MALQMGALRDALLSAGATEEKASKAAEEAASYEARLANIDAKLTVMFWVGGVLFAAMLGSQALIWHALGTIDGQIGQIGSQVSHIEQIVTTQR